METSLTPPVTPIQPNRVLNPFPRIETDPPASATTGHKLFNLRQIEVNFEPDHGILWSFIRPDGRPSYNPALLADFNDWQDGIEDVFRGDPGFRYLVLGSRFPGVFCLGGDLNLFSGLIRRGDRAGLIDYGRACVRILHRNANTLDLPIVTIGLVQGDALGGGFESLMSFNVIVAERGVKFGLPENLFGLFPGMGALSFLSRRLGQTVAEEMVRKGTIYTAEEMYELGMVQVLCEPGEGETAVRRYVAQTGRRHGGQRAMYRASREVNVVTLDELERVVDIWADAALGLTEQDLRMMERLVAAQNRLLGIPTATAAE